jgi:hypothetical protein
MAISFHTNTGFDAPTSGTVTDFVEDSQGLVLATSQDIPQSWADHIAEIRKASWEARKRTEHVHVASIPTIFVHKWLREGFDAYAAPIREVVARLRNEGLDGFLTTEKRAV